MKSGEAENGPVEGGPLQGIRIVEIAGLGPTPFGVMLLGDLGAHVIRVDRRVPTSGDWRSRVLSRNRRSISVDLKQPEGVAVVDRLIRTADVLVEGLRPGVMERLGVGPDACLASNPRLIYARMTGWGTEGPWARRAGHDINYAGLAGAVGLLGPGDAPPPTPLNFIADFGGGGTFLALGILAALHERQTSDRGQVLDVAMVDGVGTMLTYFHGLLHRNRWSLRREDNVIDGAAPFYRVYETEDGKHMAVGALEPVFYERFIRRLGLDPAEWPQHDSSQWTAQRRTLQSIFARKTRVEWEEVFDDADCCVTPVLKLDEIAAHEHMIARQAFVSVGDEDLPRPAPRFSRTDPPPPRPAPRPGDDTVAILSELGYADDAVADLIEGGIAGLDPDARAPD